MWLVLASRHDSAALWAASRLRARLGAVTVLSPELLFSAASWTHRLGDGAPHSPTTTLTIADGSTVHSQHLRGVLNRIPCLPEDLFAGGSDVDRAYARQEVTALMLSWLAALPCPVVNRPSGRGLAGWWARPLEWAAMAARAGLDVARREEVRSVRAASDTAQAEGPNFSARIHDAASLADAAGIMFVVGDRTLWCGPGDASAWAGACRRLAGLVQCELLAVHLAAVGGGLAFAGAEALPDLRPGGEALIDGLAAVLAGAASAPRGVPEGAMASSALGGRS